MSESELDCVIGRISKYIPEENQKTVIELLGVLIGRAQDDGFMKGYKYAIRILEESIVKKKT